MNTGNICLLPEPQIAVVHGEVKELHGFVFERKLSGDYDRIPLLGSSLAPGKTLSPDAEMSGQVYCICAKSKEEKILTPDNLLCMERCGSLNNGVMGKTFKELCRYGIGTRKVSHGMKLKLISRVVGESKILQIEINGEFWRELGEFWPTDVYDAVHVFKTLGSTIPNLDMQDALEEEEVKIARMIMRSFSNITAYGGEWRYVGDEEFVFDGVNTYRSSDPWDPIPQSKEEFIAMIGQMEEEEYG